MRPLFVQREHTQMQSAVEGAEKPGLTGNQQTFFPAQGVAERAGNQLIKSGRIPAMKKPARCAHDVREVYVARQHHKVVLARREEIDQFLPCFAKNRPMIEAEPLGQPFLNGLQRFSQAAQESRRGALKRPRPREIFRQAY